MAKEIEFQEGLAKTFEIHQQDWIYLAVCQEDRDFYQTNSLNKELV